MLFPIVLHSSGDIYFSFSLTLAHDFRNRYVHSSFSLRGVLTTQTDKSNPENDTGDVVSSGKKVGPELIAENPSRGELPIQITG